MTLTMHEVEAILNPETRKALKGAGSYDNAVAFVEDMLRNVDGPIALRIKSGDLTEEEVNEPDDFYRYRHAAWLYAHYLYDMCTA